MQIEYSDKSNKPGVYKITNLIDGKVYIGSAKCFKVRLNQHLNSLNKNKHQNKHLQSAFNLYGTDNFKFEVLEALEDSTKEYRFQIEQEYLDEYVSNWEACYNFKKQTIQKERSCFSNTPEETSRLLSIASQKMWDELSDEDRETRIRTLKETGHNNTGKIRSEDTKELLSLASKERWKNNSDVMLKAVNNNLLFIDRQKQKEATKVLRKQYQFISPGGDTITFVGLREFCRNHKLPYTCISRLISGKRTEYKGWKLAA